MMKYTISTAALKLDLFFSKDFARVTARPVLLAAQVTATHIELG
jgi:hypothetical protein